MDEKWKSFIENKWEDLMVLVPEGIRAPIVFGSTKDANEVLREIGYESLGSTEIVDKWFRSLKWEKCRGHRDGNGFSFLWSSNVLLRQPVDESGMMEEMFIRISCCLVEEEMDKFIEISENSSPQSVNLFEQICETALQHEFGHFLDFYRHDISKLPSYFARCTRSIRRQEKRFMSGKISYEKFMSNLGGVYGERMADKFGGVIRGGYERLLKDWRDSVKEYTEQIGLELQ